jgi:hypothetical protein
MTIELNCPHCHKFLRTADDKAGLTANCPGCGEAITIPAASELDPAEVTEIDEAAEEGEDRQPCPLCGGMIRKSARKCRYCGEVLAPELEDVPDALKSTSLDLGDLMRDTWALYRDDFGLVFGGVFVAGLIISIPNFAMFPVSFSVAMQQPDNHLLQNELSALTSFLQLLVAGFMMGGQMRLLINVVRGENPRFTDIFRGGRYYFRMLVGLFLAYIGTFVGCLLLIVPGAWLISIFTPWLFLLVDQNLGLFSSFGEARRITRGQRMQIFLIVIVNIVLAVGSYIACCLPLLFMVPYNWLMYALVCERLKRRASLPAELSEPEIDALR